MPTPSKINPLQLRAVLGRHWSIPKPHGPTGWRLDLVLDDTDGIRVDGRVIVTQAPAPLPDHDAQVTAGRADLTEWIHASMSLDGRLPTYEDMCRLHRAVWGDTGESYEIHPPKTRHVNINEFVLHLWGRADGARVLPDFGRFGTI